MVYTAQPEIICGAPQINVLYKQPLNNCQLSRSMKLCMGSEHLPHPAKKLPCHLQSRNQEYLFTCLILWISKKMRASVLAPSEFRWAQYPNTKQNKRPSQWMNFSELIKSKFKSGDEITSLLCWMDMISQILVDLHLEISSLAWKHQISRHAMEDCLWKMVGFPTQSWILEYVVGLYMEKYAHNLHLMDKRIIMVTIE